MFRDFGFWGWTGGRGWTGGGGCLCQNSSSVQTRGPISVVTLGAVWQVPGEKILQLMVQSSEDELIPARRQSGKFPLDPVMYVPQDVFFARGFRSVLEEPLTGKGESGPRWFHRGPVGFVLAGKGAPRNPHPKAVEQRQLCPRAPAASRKATR